MGFDGGAGGPGLECLVGLPLGDDEIAVLAFDRAQQLKPEKAGLIVDCMRTVREALFQFRTGIRRDLDCVDLHHGVLAGHDSQATACCRHDGFMDRDPDSGSPGDPAAPEMLVRRGGSGPPMVLAHGLMGRGSTWGRQLPWLTKLGEVFTYDAPWHRGMGVADRSPICTERFVADLGDAVVALGAPVILVGHSMGALHSWCLAAERPELVAAVVVEDMAPDFRGRTTGPWEPWLHALPTEFATEQQVFDEFGPVAGQYFLEAFDRTATGWRLHGDPQRWIEIAAEWGTREYWSHWRSVSVPALLLEAGNSVTPTGQMSVMAATGMQTTHLRVPGAGHLIHDDAPTEYRTAVEAFLSKLIHEQ